MYFTEQHELIRKLARGFAETELTKEILDEIEETEVFPEELLDKMAKAGFFEGIRRTGGRCPFLCNRNGRNRKSQRCGEYLRFFSQLTVRRSVSAFRDGGTEGKVSDAGCKGKKKGLLCSDGTGSRL